MKVPVVSYFVMAISVPGMAPCPSPPIHVVWYAPANLGWDLAATVASSPVPTLVCDSLEAIIAEVKRHAKPGTQVVIMSNGGFGGLHGKLAAALEE